MFSKDWGSKKLFTLMLGVSTLAGAVALSYQTAAVIHREFSVKQYSFSFTKVSDTLQNPWKIRENQPEVIEPFKLISYRVEKLKPKLRAIKTASRNQDKKRLTLKRVSVENLEKFEPSFFDIRLTLAQQLESLSELSVNPKTLPPQRSNPVHQEVKPTLLSRSEPTHTIKREPSSPVVLDQSGYSLKVSAKNQRHPNEVAKIEYSPGEEVVGDIAASKDPLPSLREATRDASPILVASAQAPPNNESIIKVETSSLPTGMGPFQNNAARTVIRIESKQNPVVNQVNSQVSTQQKDTQGTGAAVAQNNPTSWVNQLLDEQAKSGVTSLMSSTTNNPCSNYQVLCLSEGLSVISWEKPYLGINFKVLSYEGAVKTSDWMWGITQRKDSWPTLSLERKTLETPVAVLTENSVYTLTQHRKTSLQENTGIIFGKIPAHFTVQIGKAEESHFDQVLYVDEASLPNERTFVFTNVTPGPQLVYLYDARGTNLGAMTAPTLQDTATYIDLRVVKTETLSGFLLNSGNSLNPVTKTSVRVLGQWNQKAETDLNGRFTFREVHRLGVYPVYIESECGSGYTHRYKASSEQPIQRSFFCFTEKMIQSWMYQFQGGVSEDSGVLMGALPTVAQSYEEGQLFPELRSLALRGQTTPEIYTLTPEGHAKIQTPLDRDLPRLLGIQLPYGALVSEVMDRAQRVVWSEMIFSSPRVLQVVGPY